MPDFATNNFLEKYGSIFDMDMAESNLSEGMGELKIGSSGVGKKPQNTINHSGGTIGGQSFSSSGINTEMAGNVAGGLLQSAPHLIQLGSNATGSQFETSADSNGPGKAGGAILSGAVTGAQAGAVLGPYGMAAGAVIGGLTSTFAHSAANKEYNQNRKERNEKESVIEFEKREKDYLRNQGLASLEGLKSLRERQLGIIS